MYLDVVKEDIPEVGAREDEELVFDLLVYGEPAVAISDGKDERRNESLRRKVSHSQDCEGEGKHQP